LYVEDNGNNAANTGSSGEIFKPLSPHHIPLFGHFSFKLAAAPYCRDEEVIGGAMTLNLRSASKRRKVEGDVKLVQRVWASLKDWQLQLWTDKEAKDRGDRPFDRAPVDRDTRIEERGKEKNAVTDFQCESLNSDDTLLLHHEEENKSWTFYFEDKENLHHWLVHLMQHAGDHRRWKDVATKR